jgi:membrane protease subunit HflK
MYKQDEPEVNLEQLLERLRSFFGRFRLGGAGGGIVYIVLGLIVVVTIGWLSTGFYTVKPAEIAALRLFGTFAEEAGPGLHWYWPSPIGTRAVVDVVEVRRLELGIRGSTPFPAESLMITGDENIVDAQLLVQYDIKDIKEFLFRVVDPAGVTMRDVAETALRQVVGARKIDDVLTVEKEAVQADTRLKIQELLDTYQAGIRIREVKLLNVNPPIQVQDAFDDVVRAKEDKEKIINLADAYEEGILPVARGDAARLRQEAEAFSVQKVNLATGQAERFAAVLGEYRNSRNVTRQRLLLEAMEEILPEVTKLILDPDVNTIVVSTGAGSGVLPLPVPEQGQE